MNGRTWYRIAFLLTAMCLSASPAAFAQSIEAPPGSAKDRFEEGMRLLKTYLGRGDHYARADAIAAELYEQHPDSPLGLILMSKRYQIALDDGDEQGARGINRFLGMALELDPENADAYAIRARVALKVDDIPTAREAVARALELDSTDTDVLFTNAKLHEKLDETEQVVHWYSVYLEHEPHPLLRRNAYYAMGEYFRTQGDRDKAHEYHRMAVELAPDQPWALHNYAWFLNHNSKEFEKAADYASRALALSSFPAARRQFAVAKYADWAERYLAGEADKSELATLQIETGMSPEDANKYDFDFRGDFRISDALVEAGEVSALNTRQVRGKSPAEMAAMRPRQEYIEQWNRIMALPEQSRHLGEMSGLVMDWAMVDPLTAMEYVTQVSNQGERARLRSLVIQNGSARHPEVMLLMIEDLSDGERQAAMRGIFWSAGKSRPEQGLEWALGLPNRQLRQEAINMLFNAWAGSDPYAAASAFETLPDSDAFPQAGHYVARHFAMADSQAALDWARSFEGHRGQLWQAALGALAVESPESALKVVAEIEDSYEQVQAVSAILSRLSNSNPIAAISYAELLPDGEVKFKHLKNAARIWARSDLEAVLDWVPSQSPSAQVQLWNTLSSEAPSIDLATAMAYPVESIPDASLHNWVRGVLGPAGRTDVYAALEWLEPLKNDPRYVQWQGMLMDEWAKQDVQGAISAAMATEDERERARNVSSLVRGWTQRDPESAASWVLDLPPGKTRDQSVRRVGSTWHRHHASAARDWALAIPEMDLRDRAIEGLIEAAQMDELLIEEYIGFLSDPERRHNARYGIIERIAYSDPIRARQLLAESDLPDAYRDAMERHIEQMMNR